MKKILFTILIVLLAFIGAGAVYIKMFLPDVGPAPKIKVNLAPERIQNGKYLAHHVAVCMDCHSTRDWSKFAGPVVPGTLGKGGEFFNEEMGFPGEIYAKNITPFHLGDWTDGEIFRAITTGMSKDGSALFPVMPYSYYRDMDREDVYDIIAYIRTLAPIHNDVPGRKVNFPMNFIMNTIPRKAHSPQKPPKEDTIRYGGYLIKMAGCIECHTPAKNGQIIAEKAFSGGFEFNFPNGLLRSANITRDTATGIGSWTAQDFLTRFKSYAGPEGISVVSETGINTPMPWTLFAGMDTTDLLAIYSYLRSLDPIKNSVVRFENRLTKNTK